MPFNTEVLKDKIGLLKLLTIIIGIINIGFTGYSYYKTPKDEAYLSCVIICFIISFIWALLIVADVLGQSDVLRRVDMLYNMVAFLFYAITVVLFFISLIQYSTGKGRIKHRLWQRVFAFVFGVVNTALYGCVSLLFYQSM